MPFFLRQNFSCSRHKLYLNFSPTLYVVASIRDLSEEKLLEQGALDQMNHTTNKSC